MKRLEISVLLMMLFSSFSPVMFKNDQKKHPRVKQAYTDKEANVKALLLNNDLDIKKLRIYLRAFKAEQKLELWAKDQDDATYKLIREYDICQTSGTLGPKRMEGDLQMPEGFYYINHFNPLSNFYLSLGINYPNASDKILGVKGKLGSAIYIHGSCVTIGCYPITDDKIKELYVFCVEARENGQSEIPVTIYPAKLTDKQYTQLTSQYKTDTDKINLWADLKKAYDYFTTHKALPKVQFLASGRHNII